LIEGASSNWLWDDFNISPLQKRQCIGGAARRKKAQSSRSICACSRCVQRLHRGDGEGGAAYITKMPVTPITEMTDRARDVFRLVVEGYIDSGAPVGSRTISKLPGINLSPASIRNVMQDLEEFGLLSHPHTSAGRVPTESGLRLFVDG
jgi:hypothetical protein